MFCANCGHELKDGAKFCTRCGAPVIPAEAGLHEAGLPENGTQGKAFPLPAVIAGLVLLFVIGFFAAKLFVRPKPHAPQEAAAAAEADYAAAEEAGTEPGGNAAPDGGSATDSAEPDNTGNDAAAAAADGSGTDGTTAEEPAEEEPFTGEPETALSITVQQIDASAYPELKLYLRIETPSGDVPADLDQTLFYIRREDANREYIEQTIEKVSQLDELETLNIDMVADVSGSMDGTPLMEAKQVMNQFLSSVQFSAGDQVELTTFSTGVYINQEFCADLGTLTGRVDALVTDDMTSLYDALYTAVTRTAARSGAKCVIAFTDGMDNYSSCTMDDVIALAQRYHIPVFIIGIGSEDYSACSTIAEQTGGRYYSVRDVISMEDIYNEIYRAEKELYMVEFTDSTGAAVTETANFIAGYYSRDYGGECAYSCTPNVLLDVDSSTLYTTGPESVVEKYIKAFDGAVTDSDFSKISPYLLQGSPIYDMQQKFVQRTISERLDSFEIVKVEYQDQDRCVVTTRETFFVQTSKDPLYLMTQECRYVVVNSGGQWFLQDFAEAVHVLNKINQ